MAYALSKKWREKKQASPGAGQIEGPSTSDTPEATTLENKDASNHPGVIAITSHGEHEEPITAPTQNDSEPPQTREEKRAARRYRTLLVIGLFCPFALQALDVTIIASALPWIASDFRKNPPN